MSFDLVVVVPMFNERRRVASALQAFRAFASQSGGRTVEFLIVDDGSTDGCGDVAAEFAKATPAIRTMRLDENRGKGAAVRAGMLAADGKLLLMTDMDLSTPLEEWLALEAALEAGADIAVGSRAVPGSLLDFETPLGRRLLGRVFNLLVRSLGLSVIRDTQCGFKLFRREAARAIFSRVTIERFAFDLEVLVFARELGFSVAEVPVHWRHSNHSTLNVLRHGYGMLLDVARLKLRHAWKRENQTS